MKNKTNLIVVGFLLIFGFVYVGQITAQQRMTAEIAEAIRENSAEITEAIQENSRAVAVCFRLGKQLQFQNKE